MRRDAAAVDVRGAGAALGRRRVGRVRAATRALRPLRHQQDRHVSGLRCCAMLHVTRVDLDVERCYMSRKWT